MIRQFICREALYALRVVSGWCDETGLDRTSRVLRVAYDRLLDQVIREKR